MNLPDNGRPVVLITDYIRDARIERSVLEPDVEVRVLGAATEDDLIAVGREGDAMIVFHEMRLTHRSLSALPRLRGVVRCGVGTDNIDLEAAGKLGIAVCNVPDYGTEEVADHALMLLLAAARRLTIAHQSIRDGIWDAQVVFGSPRLRGKTLGLIGCGRIGSAMARRALVLGMRVVFHDPYKPDGYEKALGVERCDRLEELLPRSNFVSIHTPLTPQTRHVLNAQTLALLPQGAIVVNTARGGCVDLQALVAALDRGDVAFAALDVFEQEPIANEAIRTHPHVVLTPHSAFYSIEGFEEMRTKAAQEARRLVLGAPARNVVNQSMVIQPRFRLPERSPEVGW